MKDENKNDCNFFERILTMKNAMKLRIAKATVVIFCAVLLGACSVFAQGVLTVKSPAELQVVQRNQQEQASVVISGVMEGGADVIEAKADLNAAAKKGKVVGWNVVAKGSVIDKGKFIAIGKRTGGLLKGLFACTDFSH